MWLCPPGAAGAQPKRLSDAELVCLAVAQVLLGAQSERTIFTRSGVPEYELHERVGRAGETEPQQRAHAEGGVADPHIPVVPVAFPADLLGQAGRRRGHDGAGRSVGQQTPATKCPAQPLSVITAARPLP